MKKIIVIVVLFICSYISSFSQNPYYDALKLNEKSFVQGDGKISFYKEDSIFISEVLKKYTKDANLYTELIVAFNSNPFIAVPTITSMTSYGIFDISKLKGVTGGLSSIGKLDVTNLADGLAKFLVERVKQELSITFFEKFKKDMDSIKQLQIVFPATFRALQAIDKEIYNFSAYLDLLRESFQKDLVLLIPHIDKLVNDKSMDVIFSKYPQVKLMLSHALFLTTEFSAGKFPGEIFHNYAVNKAKVDSTLLDSINIYLWPSIATLDLFSQSLRSRQTGQYWIGADSLKLLFDKNTFQIYIGLIYQQVVNNPIYFTDKESLASNLLKYGSKINELRELYEPYLFGLIEEGKSVGSYFNAIKEKQIAGKDKPTYQDYYSLYDASINFIEYLSQSPFLDKLLPTDNQQNLEDYFITARGLGNIYIDLYEKQYTSAIVEFSYIVDILLRPKINEQIKVNKNQIKNSEDLKATLEKTNADLEKIADFNSFMLKYGSFAASMAKAETSNDVKNAIEAAALPAGSSRIKRETPFNVSLNAYTGLFMGHEKIVGMKDSRGINSYGLTAPVGIAVSWGSHKFFGIPDKRGSHWSYSAFVSLIDIGTVAAFRFQNDSIAQVPTIQLQDIFSPGLFLSIGIPKCPLSFNLGAQVGPNLREVYVEDVNNPGEFINSYQDNLYWRFSASVVVDIPLLNFYTKSK
jgi:hypothetical protein